MSVWLLCCLCCNAVSLWTITCQTYATADQLTRGPSVSGVSAWQRTADICLHVSRRLHCVEQLHVKDVVVCFSAMYWLLHSRQQPCSIRKMLYIFITASSTYCIEMWMILNNCFFSPGTSRTVFDLGDGLRTQNSGLGLKEVWLQILLALALALPFTPVTRV